MIIEDGLLAGTFEELIAEARKYAEKSYAGNESELFRALADALEMAETEFQRQRRAHRKEAP